MNKLIESIVIKGKQLGRDLGFPTANMLVSDDFSLSLGVYAVRVFVLDEEYFGVANLGHKPTVDSDASRSLEVHIFDFSKDIYNQKIKVEFLSKLRDEQKFDTLEQLREEIESDVKQAKENFKNNIYVY